MVPFTQVPAKHSYFVIRVKLLRLRILHKNFEKSGALMSVIELYALIGMLFLKLI
jgi:hypothetical protein